MLPAPVVPFAYDALPTVTAEALRKQAARIRARVKATTEAIIEVGRDLIAVKQQLEHGQFSEWVMAECGFTLRSAENYIRAAEFAEGKNETVSLLPPAAVYRLAAKNAPAEIVKEVLDRVQSGTPVSTSDVSDALANAARERREQKREAIRAARRKEVPKQTLARRAKRAREEEAEARKAREKSRAKALSIINTVGEENAQFLVDILSGYEGWEILRILREEVDNLAEKSAA